MPSPSLTLKQTLEPLIPNSLCHIPNPHTMGKKPGHKAARLPSYSSTVCLALRLEEKDGGGHRRYKFNSTASCVTWFPWSHQLQSHQHLHWRGIHSVPGTILLHLMQRDSTSVITPISAPLQLRLPLGNSGISDHPQEICHMCWVQSTGLVGHPQASSGQVVPTFPWIPPHWPVLGTNTGPLCSLQALSPRWATLQGHLPARKEKSLY